MKKFMIAFICVLACLTLFTGCTGKKNDSQQDQERGNSVEIDDADLDGADIEVDTTGNPDLPEGFTYSFRDPDNADGIVITPRE